MNNTLDDLIALAAHIGARPDYTQGGGGNVSLKNATTMQVKASGLRLSELSESDHFVTINHEAVRGFNTNYNSNATLEDLIAASDTVIRNSLVTHTTRRPSIETGFHALLGETVLHTHSVYVNTLTCSQEGRALLQEIFPKSVYISYNTPGVALTLAIASAVATVESDIIFLENHGLIIVAATPAEALRTHELVNNTVRHHLNLDAPYPTIAVTKHDDTWLSGSPTLQARIAQNPHTLQVFNDTILFPDQVVYGEGLSFDVRTPDKVTIDTNTGAITYRTGYNEALAIEETLAAWLFIHDTITKLGFTHKTLAATEGVFIANLDSEKYRKSVL